MAADHVIPELDRNGLRSFGLTTGGIVAGLFGLLFPLLLQRSWPLWPWVLFAALGGMALLAPMALKPVYWGWMRLGLLINRVTTPLVLGIVFFLVISPIAFWRRLRHTDSMARSFDKDTATYRVPSSHKSRDSFEKPF